MSALLSPIATKLSEQIMEASGLAFTENVLLSILLKRCLNYLQVRSFFMNMPKEIRRYCPKCKKHTMQKVSLYKAGKRRGSAIGERRHAEDKKGYGGQKFPKRGKTAKKTKKKNPILMCPELKKKIKVT